MLVLQVLSKAKANGYEIAKTIEDRSGDSLIVDHGSLYPALRRLESSGWISAKEELSPTNRKARYYELTPAGQKQIEVERERWRASAQAITRVMRTAAPSDQTTHPAFTSQTSHAVLGAADRRSLYVLATCAKEESQGPEPLEG